jgi:drug/metabolite transporter (DMT)-like permease
MTTATVPSSTSRRDGLIGWALIIAPGCIWGASYLFIAEGLDAMRPEGITFVRTVIGFLVLSVVPGVRRPIQPTDRRKVALLGVIWLAFPMSMFPFAEQRVSSALTGLLNAASPLFVVIAAAGIVRRMPSRSVQLAVLVGMVGSVIIAAPTIGEGRNSTVGVGLIMAALISYGFAINLARPLQQRNGALPVMWRAVGIAAVLTAPTGLPAFLDARWTTRAVLSMLALGALGTGFANILVATAAGRTTAARASAMGFIIPAVSLVLGIVVRDEKVSPISIFGAVVCVGGAVLLTRAAS